MISCGKKIEITGVSKTFGKKTALRNLSYDLPIGKVVGLIGPNGSGKTTFLKCFSGIWEPDRGEIQFPDGLEKTSIGFCFEDPAFYNSRSPYRNLELIAELRGCDPGSIGDAILEMKIENYLYKAFKSLSHGQKQKVNITSAVLGHPSIIIFDEPNNGLDPEGFILFRELVERLKSEERTIIISSHLLFEMDKMCDHVMLFKNGDIIDDVSMDDFSKRDLESLYKEKLMAE